MNAKYNTLHKKISSLEKKTPPQQTNIKTQFFKRTYNQTNVVFDSDEQNILN
jgi:hypothetical protein